MANYRNLKNANAEIERLRNQAPKLESWRLWDLRNANAEIERLRKQAQVPKESWRSRALYVTLGFITGLLARWSAWLAIAVLALAGLVWLFRANWTANIKEARSVFDRRVSNGTDKIAGVNKRMRNGADRITDAGRLIRRTVTSDRDWYFGAPAYVLITTLIGFVVGGWLGQAIWTSPGWRGALLGAIIGMWSSATLAIVFALNKEES